MDRFLDFPPLTKFLVEEQPHLVPMLSREGRSRPQAKGSWEEIILHGFSGKGNNRTRTKPDFYGDGALRFQAIVDIDFDQASAIDVTTLIDATLDYLVASQP